MRFGRLAGHYFLLAGTASILGMIASPFLQGSLRIDLGFLLSFWVGFGLLRGREGFRKGALVFLGLGVLVALGFLVWLILAKPLVTGSGSEARTPLLAALYAGIVLVLLLPPVVLLLLPSTREWFRRPRESSEVGYSPSKHAIAVYVVASAALIAGGFALESSTRIAAPSGVSTSFEYGEKRIGVAAAGWMEDEASRRRLYVSWVAFGESNSVGRSSEGNDLRFGSYAVPVPEMKKVRYIGSPPQEPATAANVFLVRGNGEVIKLRRRIVAENVETVIGLAQGVRDFDQLKERLESQLPAAAPDSVPR